MRTAETVLQVIHERGKKGLPLEDVYRQLFNPDLYRYAYGRIYSNKGAMTPGSTEETADGMSQEKINSIIEAIRFERWKWTPVRRTNIPKKNGKTRPLGIPTWSDKLLQEVIRCLLEAYYEPQFSDYSHGFRPGRGCQTALSSIQRQWKGTKWYIEGDIKGCFDNIDHEMLLNILSEKLHDNRFLRLMRNLLQAGYLEHWKYNQTLSGAPQGGIVSPILSNIYLDRLDQYVEKTLLKEYTRGRERQDNPAYVTLVNRAAWMRRSGRHDQVREVEKQYQSIPSYLMDDPNFRRITYVRYADDFLLGFAGPKAEAEEIKAKLQTFLHDKLKLEMSEDKTLITHATTQAARLLGYHIVNQRNDTWHDRQGRRTVNGTTGLRVPKDVVDSQCALYMKDGISRERVDMVNDDDFTIISNYQSVYRGVVQYYMMAQNVSWFNRLHFVMQGSLLKTLAEKNKSSVAKERARLLTVTMTKSGTRKCLEMQVARKDKKPLIARFGGIPLKRNRNAVLVDQRLSPVRTEGTELIKRLLADTCELCGSTEKVEVHHIRKVTDLNKAGQTEKPRWIQVMSNRRRKTLMLCRKCHDTVEHGLPRR